MRNIADVSKSFAKVSKIIAQVSISYVKVSRNVAEVTRSVDEVSKSVTEVSKSVAEVSLTLHMNLQLFNPTVVRHLKPEVEANTVILHNLRVADNNPSVFTGYCD